MTSSRRAPTLPRISRTFSITAFVCERMSSCVVPISSTSAPAMVLLARRALVPETIRKSPARFTWGYLPRGFAFPATTLLARVFIDNCSQIFSQADANVVQLGIKVQRVHAAFASNSGQSRAAKRRAQIAQEPAIHPGNAHIHPLRHA